MATARIRAIQSEPQRLRQLPDEAVLELVENETDPLFRAMAEQELNDRTCPEGWTLTQRIRGAVLMTALASPACPLCSRGVSHTHGLDSAQVRPALPAERTNFVLECPCGLVCNIASSSSGFAHDCGERHIREHAAQLIDLIAGKVPGRWLEPWPLAAYRGWKVEQQYGPRGYDHFDSCYWLVIDPAGQVASPDFDTEAQAQAEAVILAGTGEDTE